MRRTALFAVTTTLALLVVLAPASLLSVSAQPASAVHSMAQAQATDALPTTTACSPDVVPIGQANPPGSQLEPLRPIWCFNPLAAPGAPSRVSGANDWVDDFSTVTQMGRFEDGDYDYRVFPNVQSQPGFRSQHFTNNQHWMDDNASGGQGGTMIRPNRSFKFENGKLVVEQDVAANISGYSGDAWVEIEITNQPAPTNDTWDNLYGYGQFGAPGSWTFGCRITNPVCSMENPNDYVGGLGSMANCFESPPHRSMELSFFEQCGTTHSGGVPEQHARECSSADQQPDMMCRDRFRMELTASGLKYYVNGFLYFEDSNWPAARQIPASVLAGDWYVYATDWQDTHPYPAYRFHWDHFAVNPHNADGSFTAPSASPSFCLGQPNNTCPMSTTPVPTNTPTTATNTPLPATATSVPPTATSTSIPPTATSVPPTATTGAATSTPVPATATATTNGKRYTRNLNRGDSITVNCSSGTLTITSQSTTSDVLKCT